MGIAGSIVNPDFFQEYLGMRNESIDLTEIIRRMDEGIYDHEEYAKAMAWTEKNCKTNEGEDFKNRPEKRKTREQKDADWEFIVKMTIIMRDLMTFCLAIFLSRRTGRYLWVVLFAMLLFAAVAYVPALEPGRVAVRSQQARAERIARSLDRLDSAGRLVLTPVPLADTVRGARYRELYEALAYLYLRDTLRLAAFGLSSTERYAELFPSDFADYVRGWTDRVPAADTDGGATRFFYLPDDAEYALGDGYSRLWLPCYSSWAEFGNDTLRVDVGGERIRIAGAELLARQLARVGVASCEELRDSREHIEPLMDYRDARCRIIFSDLSLERTDSLGWRIAGAQLRAVMLR